MAQVKNSRGRPRLTPEQALAAQERKRTLDRERSRTPKTSEQIAATNARRRISRRAAGVEPRFIVPADERSDHRRAYDQQRFQREMANEELRAARYAAVAARRAVKGKATPRWLTPAHHQAIRRVYRFARMIMCDVDHIVPLRGEFVSGLHVPWNLRAIPRPDNRKKGNRHT